MRIRIVSDGTAAGTRVTDERGEKLEMVQAVEWRIEVKHLATATITFARVPVDIETDAEVAERDLGSNGTRTVH